MVLEATGSEITLSPIHTCGMNIVRAGSGLTIRFPRFTGRYRDDKSPEQATTNTGDYWNVPVPAREGEGKANSPDKVVSGRTVNRFLRDQLPY